MTPKTKKTAEVLFEDSKYNYETSVNAKLTDEEIKAYFIGKKFNLGGIKYDHNTDTEIEYDNMQLCIGCNVTSKNIESTN